MHLIFASTGSQLQLETQRVLCSNAKEKKMFALYWSIEMDHFYPGNAIHLLIPAANPKLSIILKGGERCI